MTGIFINGNRKQRITNDEFDVMVELMKAENDLVLQRMSEKVSESDDQLLRWKDDQKTYHQNYYNKNLTIHLRGLRKDDIKQVQPIQTQEKQCMQ